MLLVIRVRRAIIVRVLIMLKLLVSLGISAQLELNLLNSTLAPQEPTTQILDRLQMLLVCLALQAISVLPELLLL